jgi:23S rRNA C2498 (ribose-2'-O)-methylase RlmM
MSAKKEINKIQDLPYYREEYTAQLADLGIKETSELLEALQDKDRKKVIVDELDGVGNKIADHWLELLSETEAETEIVEDEEKAVPNGQAGAGR